LPLNQGIQGNPFREYQGRKKDILKKQGEARKF